MCHLFLQLAAYMQLAGVSALGLSCLGHAGAVLRGWRAPAIFNACGDIPPRVAFALQDFECVRCFQRLIPGCLHAVCPS